MKEKHIILRGVRAATRDIFLGPMAMPGTAPGFPSLTPSEVISLSVDIEEIDRREIRSITRSADVLAIAPSMPMKLIQPIPLGDEATVNTMNQDIAWGVKAVGADSSPYTGEGITVAVLDTGIDAGHEAFAGENGVSILQKDFTGEGNDDVNGHGTHCAGTIFGRKVGDTRIGVATGVKRALIGKVLGEQGGASEMIVSAIQWALENGANVISMSLGMDFPGFREQLQKSGMPEELATSRALEAYRANVLLFERLASLIRIQGLGGFSQPAILVAAAGNESRRSENANFEIAVSPPAVSEGFISVAALGQSPAGLFVAPFSNTFANISAPGMMIISAKAGGGLRLLNGTSMATPHVAGVAALWAEKIIKNGGSLNSQILTNRLMGSATTEGLKQGYDPSDIGIGLVRAPQG